MPVVFTLPANLLMLAELIAFGHRLAAGKASL